MNFTLFINLLSLSNAKLTTSNFETKILFISLFSFSCFSNYLYTILYYVQASQNTIQRSTAFLTLGYHLRLHRI